METKVDLFRPSNQVEQAPAIVATMEPDLSVEEMDVAQAEEPTEGTPPETEPKRYIIGDYFASVYRRKWYIGMIYRSPAENSLIILSHS